MGNETEDRQAGGLIGVPIRLPGGLVLLLHLFISLDDGSATILSNVSVKPYPHSQHPFYELTY